MSSPAAENRHGGPDEQLAIPIPSTSYFNIAPQLKSLVALFYGDEYDETHEAEWELPAIAGRERREASDGRYHTAAIVAAATAVILAEGEPVDPRGYMRELLLANFDRRSISEGHIESWASHLDYSLYAIAGTRAKVDEILVPLEQAVATDGLQTFRLLKVLSSPHVHLGPKNSDNEGESLALLCCFDHFDRQKTGIVDLVSSQLEGGAFDSQIAQELLHEAVAEVDKASSSQATEELRKLVRVLQLCGGTAAKGPLDEAEAIHRLSSPTVLQEWTAGPAETLTARRVRYREELEKRIRERQAVLHGNGYILPEATPESLERSVQDYKTLLAAMGNRASLRLKMTKVEVTQARIRQRQARRGQRGFHGPHDQLVSHEPEFPMRAEPRTLTFINALGEEEAPDNEGNHKFVTEYLAKSGGDPRLAQTVEEALIFLQLIDLSKGNVDGLQPHLDSVWQFTPKSSPHVPTPTEKSKKLRILCKFEHEKVGILALGERADIVKVKRNLGIPVSSSVAKG